MFRSIRRFCAQSLLQRINVLNFRQAQLMRIQLRLQRLEQQKSALFLVQCDDGDDPRNAFLQDQQKKANWPGGQLNMTKMALGLYRSSQDKKEEKVVEQAKKSIFDVQISSIVAAQKLKIIKAVKDILGISLKEAKESIQKLPNVIKRDMNEQEALKLKKSLEDIGCKVQLV